MTDADASLDALIEAEIIASRPAPECSVKVFRDRLDDSDRTALDKWLASRVPSSAIHRALKRRGFERTDQAIAKHRRGLCSCRSTTN